MNYGRTAQGISDYMINTGGSRIYHDRARTFALTPNASLPNANSLARLEMPFIVSQVVARSRRLLRYP